MSIFDSLKKAKTELCLALGLSLFCGLAPLNKAHAASDAPEGSSSELHDGFRSPLGYFFDGLSAGAKKLNHAIYGHSETNKADSQAEPYTFTGIGPISKDEFQVSYIDRSFDKSPYVCVVVLNDKLDTQDITVATLAQNKSLQRVMHFYFMHGKLVSSEALMKPVKEDLTRAWSVPEDSTFDSPWKEHVLGTVASRFKTAVDWFNATRSAPRTKQGPAVGRPPNPAHGQGLQERKLTK